MKNIKQIAHDLSPMCDIASELSSVICELLDELAHHMHGAWGVYPYFESGNILVSDMQTGLYVFELSTSSTRINEISFSGSIYPNPISSSFIIPLYPVGSTLPLFALDEIYSSSSFRVQVFPPVLPS